ncbi:MAG: translocation/assembly module TamB domain-containing protein [Crocinitomicaceae bacterium]
MKLIGRTVSILVDVLLISIIIFSFIVRTTRVQTFLAQQATAFLSKELGTKLHIDEVSLVFFDRVALQGVYVEDQSGDTLADISTLHIRLKTLDLVKNKITLSGIELEKGNVHLIRDSLTADYNYWFLTDYFASGPSTSTSEPMALELEKLQLTDVHFRYDDMRKYYSTFGMDWDHLDFKHVYLKAKNIHLVGNDVACYITDLSTTEKSGFVLDHLSTKARVVKKGIYLDKLSIHTPVSEVYMSKMYLKMHQLQDIYTFEDSVSFDANILPSRVSMKDISYFASALEGMDQIVHLSGQVTKKVDNLRISNLDLQTGKKTVLKGTLNLVDFNNIESAFFQEKIDYAYLDLNDIRKIKLPYDNGGGTPQLDKYVERLGHFEGKKVRLDGFYSQFVLAAESVMTDLGSIQMDNGILFTENKAANSYFFEKSIAGEYDVKVNNFDLGSFLQEESFGKMDGTFFFSGEAFSSSDIRFDLIDGNVDRFDFMDYSYENITIEDGHLDDSKLTAKIDVKDDNLNLVYDGSIDFKNQQHMEFSIDLTRAVLDNLGFTNVQNTVLESNFSVDLYGTSENDVKGTIVLNGLLYQEGNKTFDIPAMIIDVKRAPEKDILFVQSKLADVHMEGKVDFAQIGRSFQDQLSQILPAIIKPVEKRKNSLAKNNHFSYAIEVKEMKEFLDIFVPGLYVESGTQISGVYDEGTSDFRIAVQSPYARYENYVANDLNVQSKAINDSLSMVCSAGIFELNDSVTVANLLFQARGSQDVFHSDLSWNPETPNYSKINWDTKVLDEASLDFIILPSQITIQEKRWDIRDSSNVEYREDYIAVDHFMFERQNQFISVKGKVSSRDEDKLILKVSHLQLDDFGALLQTPMELKGEVNGFGEISTPFDNIGFNGDASVKGLYINDEEVGDVFVQSQWVKGDESVKLLGDLIYRNTQTFSFDGEYHVNRKKDNLDFNLLFDHTDIQFANAFMDPQVLSDITGTLDGSLEVHGTPDEPKLAGDVVLSNGGARVGILGVKFQTKGKIEVDEYGFYMNNLPVIDEEGNAGSIVGSIYHDNFLNWNFDLNFNLEDDAINRDPIFSWKVIPLKKFLVMNTDYKEGDYYYGKAYVTGYANIYGYADNLEITVDAKTQKGTTINFPMYGTSEISDEESFIQFLDKDTTFKLTDPKIDFTGVELNLNFDVTPDAKLKIIFDEKLGDEISADGSGMIRMRLDNLGDITLDGNYVVNSGVYNFAMGPIKQNFYIQEGGNITWTGDPYNANLNLKSYYKVNANLSEISVDQLSNTGNAKQEIYCYLDITETLFAPAIAFEIQAPKASESGKSLINRINSDPEELNRQFFSLLLFKSFQPLKGSTTSSSGAALDLAANQINSMLSQLSQNYKMAVNMDANSATGDKTFEFGVSKQFLDNRLILTGSFGVENSTTGSTDNQAQSFLIGDVNLEYLLNESGTFRVNIFNESNQNRVIQDNNQGMFKQGVGLHYQEDFNSFQDFKIAQYFLDIFRKKGNKRYPIKRKKSQTPVPKDSSSGRHDIIKTEENV